MSVVTNQPLPFGHLEREKHIEMIFRAFQNRCGPSCQHQSLSSGLKSHQIPPQWDSDEQLSGTATGREMVKSSIRGKQKTSRAEVFGGAQGTDSVSMLDMVSQIHITARPELQGPQCVPRRIYSITTDNTLHLFVAVEESSCVCLQCCGPGRACSLKGFDCQGQQVFYFERPLRMDACCFGCCLMEMRVYTPQKQLIGTVCQRWSMFTPLLEVCDSNGASTIRIQGSCCPCRCLSNQHFEIVSNIGEKIGTVWKKWPGFNDEHNMDHEYFGLDVPPHMESQTKLLLLAASFLLSHMFFEMS